MRFPICQSSGQHTLILSSFFPSTLLYESTIKLASANMSSVIHRTWSCKQPYSILQTTHNLPQQPEERQLRYRPHRRNPESWWLWAPTVHGKEIQVLSKCFGTTVSVIQAKEIKPRWDSQNPTPTIYGQEEIDDITFRTFPRLPTKYKVIGKVYLIYSPKGLARSRLQEQ